MEERRRVPAAVFSGPVEFQIASGRILIGGPVLDQVQIGREPGASDVEIKIHFQAHRQRFDRWPTQKQAEEIARGLGADQSRDDIRKLLATLGGPMKPGPKGPRGKSRGNMRDTA